MMYLSKKFYLSEVKHSKAIKVLRRWEEERRNVSELVCTAIELLGEEEEKRSCSKLDYFVEQERKKKEMNERIDNFVLLIDGLSATARGLLEQYEPDQLKKLNTACMMLHFKLEDALTLNTSAGR